MPSTTDVPTALYVNGQLVSVHLDSRCTWVIHADARYLADLARVAGEAAERLARQEATA